MNSGMSKHIATCISGTHDVYGTLLVNCIMMLSFDDYLLDM